MRLLQIELTNECNRSCQYCGQVNMTRPKGYMDDETFYRSVAILVHEGQKIIGLNNYGESLLHPNFVFFVCLLNQKGIDPWCYTNGDLLNDKYIDRLKGLNLTLIISGHAPIAEREELARKLTLVGIQAVVQDQLGPTNTIDIAKQVTGYVATPSGKPLIDPMNQCAFLHTPKSIVLWNGDLVPCCMDYDGTGVFGNIHDENVLDLKPKVMPLCAQCAGHPGS